VSAIEARVAFLEVDEPKRKTAAVVKKKILNIFGVRRVVKKGWEEFG
jgi:hypothetical protein